MNQPPSAGHNNNNKNTARKTVKQISAIPMDCDIIVRHKVSTNNRMSGNKLSYFNQNARQYFPQTYTVGCFCWKL